MNDLKKLLADPKWRRDSGKLYKIENKDGIVIPFVPNLVQRRYDANKHNRNIILKARQQGFSTKIGVDWLDTALFRPNTRLGMLADTLDNARQLLRNKVLFPYQNLPNILKDAVHLTVENSDELVFANGSRVKVGTSLRGETFQYLHISEHGKICAKFPDKAEEIRTGALNTVPRDGFVVDESTAEGNEGDFFELVEKARALERMGVTLTPLDYKFHFFPWYESPEYILPEFEGEMPEKVDKYCNELEEALRITLSVPQRAWYYKMEDTQKDKMKREYPSTPDEAFKAAIDGAFYGAALATAEEDGRITKVPYDPALPVETHWDLGMRDNTSIVFVQRTRTAVHVIDFYQSNNEALPHYVTVLDKKGYRYSRHVLPHDGAVRDLGTGFTRQETLEKLGLKNVEVAKGVSLDAGITAVKNILPKCYFDAVKCEELVACLKNYRRAWNTKLGILTERPLHDENSHAADAFRTFATAEEPLDASASPLNIGRLY